MSCVMTKEIIYKNFGKCLEISNGRICAVITLDVGPRIIKYAFTDGENVLYEDIKREISKADLEPFAEGTWQLYGGHRLWAAPEEFPRTYYPDNDPVSYDLLDNGACFTASTQKWNQHKYIITVTMAPESSTLTVKHEIKNEGAWPVTLAPWAVTVLSSGGTEVVPQPQKDTGLIPNRVISLWAYSKMNDERVTWGDKYITLKQDSKVKENFKFGISNDYGYAMYFNRGELFIKKFDVTENGSYPDGGVCYESYLCPQYLEMETLGVLSEVKPGKSVSLCEYWSLFKEEYPGNDENKIDGLVKKYVR